MIGWGRRMSESQRTIGILYESDEWSDHKLADELRLALQEEGCQAQVALIDMQQADAIERALGCDLLVSRVFASALFRNHEAALANMEELIEKADAAGVPMLNTGSAHRFEIDKRASTEVLAKAGVAGPAVYACAKPRGIDVGKLDFPCVIKPNCGGRTTYTAISENADQARSFLESAPDIEFIAEEYIKPERGYLTRIEIADGAIALIVKRSVAESGLSGYHEGSTYAAYDDPLPELVEDALAAARALGFAFGSFDVIESRGECFFIDANSVSNVSEDCTELLGCDLMAAHARGIARRYKDAQMKEKA